MIVEESAAPKPRGIQVRVIESLEPIDFDVSTIGDVIGRPEAQRRLRRAIDRVLANDRYAPTTRATELAAAEASVRHRRERLLGAIEEGTVSNFDARDRIATLRTEESKLRREREAIASEAERRDRLVGEREQFVALMLDFERAAAELKGPALREHLRPWIRSAVFNSETRMLTIEVRHVPAVELGGTVFPPDQKHAGVTVRQVRVGTDRRLG